jgi:thiamine biosynthesis lipoprotein
VSISRDLAAALRAAGRVHAASGGAFDPTLWPLKRLWRDAAARGRPPTEDELGAVLSRVGLSRTRVEGDPPRLTRAVPGIQLDLGGIAKGYAVDRLGRVLGARGVTAAVVQLGGEILAFGESDVGPWRLGVQHPTERGQLYGVVEHRGTVRLSTSGNYQQPVRIGGKTYYHVLIPSTGRPASTDVRGVTVASFAAGPDSATLDAAATAAVVLGAKRAKALVVALGGEALLIEGTPAALREAVTPGFAARWRRRAQKSD